ncbi:MAG: acyltransferase [Burkholderiaceae bacterium]
MNTFKMNAAAINVGAVVPQEGLARLLALHVPALDGWRGLAIAGVLISHFIGVERAALGRLGVDLFFVLSGLLMSNILFVKRTNLLLFYQRRISRIFPALWLFIATVFVGAWAGGVAVPWRELLPTLFFVRSYVPAVPDIWHTSLPIGHLWSLNIEEHCYLLMGLLTLVPIFSGRRAWIALIGFGFLSMGLRLLPVYAPGWLEPLGGNMVGIRTETASSHLLISAGYLLVREKFEPYVAPWAPPLALGLGIFCYTHWAPWWGMALVAPFLFAFAVNHLHQAAKHFTVALAWRPLRMLGIWSFSIYLWQQPFYLWRAEFPVGMALVLALLMGLLSFYWVEQPARDWLNTRWAKKPTTSA